MSCGTCGIQASNIMQGDTGVPAGAPTTAPPRCPFCAAFIATLGAPCQNPQCPGLTTPAEAADVAVRPTEPPSADSPDLAALTPLLPADLPYLDAGMLRGVQANLAPDPARPALPPRQEVLPLAGYVACPLTPVDIATYKLLLARWEAGQMLADADLQTLHQLAARRFGSAANETTAIELRERRAVVAALELVKQARGLPGFLDPTDAQRVDTAALALRQCGALRGRRYLPGLLTNLPPDLVPDLDWMLPAAGQLPWDTRPLTASAGEVADFNCLMETYFEQGRPMLDKDLDRLYGYTVRRLCFALTKAQAGPGVTSADLLTRWSGLQAVSLVRRARGGHAFVDEAALLSEVSAVLRQRYPGAASPAPRPWDRGARPPLVAMFLRQVPEQSNYARPILARHQAVQRLWASTLPAQTLAQATGVLLTGGGDVSPLLYGEVPHPQVRNLDPDRDEVELYAAQRAWAEGLPVLGICRGAQVMAVALGGTLYQDLPSTVAGAVDHAHSTHAVTVVPDSHLARTLGTTRLMVNSHHHQAIREVPPGWRAVAWADDGVIEAIEPVDPAAHPGCVCVQWHPERLAADTSAGRLFDWWAGQVARNGQRGARRSA